MAAAMMHALANWYGASRTTSHTRVADRRIANPLHVCYLCNEYPPATHGGVGSATQTLARSLVRRGAHVTVIGVYDLLGRVVEHDQGVRVIRLPHARVRGTGALVNGWRVRREINRLHGELPIHVIEGPEMSFGTMLGALPAPTIIRMHGGHHFFAATLGQPSRLWSRWLELRSFRKADHLCAVSRYVAETTRGLLGLSERPIPILPNPVESTLFEHRSGLKEDRGLILFVGTVCEKKGIRQLVDAMQSVLRSIPDARLLIVGRDWHDPTTGSSYTAYLRREMPSALRNAIAFHGPASRSSLPALIARASVCVYPSHMEAMGLVIAEAMLMGKAVIASSAGPGPELIETGASGLLCNPRDPQSIARHIVHLLTDAEQRHRLGENAHARAAALFADTTQAELNEAFYRRCTKVGALA